MHRRPAGRERRARAVRRRPPARRCCSARLPLPRCAAVRALLQPLQQRALLPCGRCCLLLPLLRVATARCCAALAAEKKHLLAGEEIFQCFCFSIFNILFFNFNILFLQFQHFENQMLNMFNKMLS